MAFQHEGDAVKGHQPLRDVNEGHQPGAGHQPLNVTDVQRPVPQDRGTPPSGGSGVKSPPKKD